MSPTDLISSFEEWSLMQAVQEAAINFGTVRKIPSATCYRFCEFVDRLSAKETSELSIAMWQRMNAAGSSARSRLASPVGTELLQKFINPGIVLLSPTEIGVQNRLKAGQHRLAERRLLKRLVIQSVSDKLQSQAEPWGAGVWRWMTESPSGVIYTDVDFGGRKKQISYFQSLKLEKEQSYTLFHKSLLSYLGISGATNWEYITEYSLREDVDCLLELIGRFLNFAKRQ